MEDNFGQTRQLERKKNVAGFNHWRFYLYQYKNEQGKNNVLKQFDFVVCATVKY